MLPACNFLSTSVLDQNTFVTVQLQLKISVIFSRILRNNTALAGAVCVGSCIWQILVILSLDAISQLRSYFCVWMVQEVAESRQLHFKRVSRFWPIGGCCQGRNVLDCSRSFAVPSDCQAVGANGLWNARDISWGSEEGCSIQRSWWAASAGAVVLAHPGRIFKWGESPFHEVCVGKISIASQHSWYLSAIPNNEGW